MIKSKNKICIIHFHALEKYPPITNLIDFLCAKNENTIVVSTKNIIGLPNYENNQVHIIRYPSINENGAMIFRLFQYLLFYVGSLFNLIIKRPDKILYYETLSSFPAIIYYYLSFKKVKLLAHYHEYSSPEEYQSGMFLSRWFHRLEQKTYPQVSWLSHTNKQRMELFINDNPNINRVITKIMPNYPPSSWSKMAKPNKDISSPLKIVYVGSVSIETMYFHEFLNWIVNQKGNVIFDIYSFEYNREFILYVNSLNCPYINLKGKLDYIHFPVTIAGYQVGVILYKGHIPNYVYNAPNKLFEYLACGLDIWIPLEMVSCKVHITENTYPKVMMLDFKNMENFDLQEAISRYKMRYKPSTYYSEEVYAQITNFLTHV